MNEEEIQAARLLTGRDELSVIEKDEIFEDVHAAVAPRARKRSFIRFAPVMAGVAAACALLVVMSQSDETAVLVPGIPDLNAEFTPRSGPSGLALEALCEPGPVCRQGSKLLMRVWGPDVRKVHLAAYALRGDGTVIWYAPGPTDATAQATQTGDWSTTTVLLGEEHTAGAYTLHAFVRETPLTRADVRTFVETGQGDGIRKLQVDFAVKP